jgi:hypothetical protein
MVSVLPVSPVREWCGCREEVNTVKSTAIEKPLQNLANELEWKGCGPNSLNSTVDRAPK